MLTGILDGGDSARLKTDLIRGSQVAASAGAGYDPYERQQALFLLTGTPSDSHSVDDLKQALFEQVKRLQQTPVTDEELARIKSQVVAEDVYEQDSTFYQAMKMGRLEAVGLSWKLAEEFVERINAVTAEQLQAVARKYLVDTGLTVAELDPQPMETGSKAQQGGGHAN